MNFLLRIAHRFKSLESAQKHELIEILKEESVAPKLPASVDEDSSPFQVALRAIQNKEPVVLVHGRAGTGKTTLVRRLIKESGLNQAVIAPTGIAALSAGGQTIHSFFGLPPQMINLDEIFPKHKLESICRRLDFLIIDEISMVRADLMDAIDKTLRVNRFDERPFGGLSLVLVGDFLQLPPIVNRHDAPILKELGYESPYCFFAKSLQNISPRIVELNTVYRQTERHFVELLAKIREGIELEETLNEINRSCFRQHRPGFVPVILTARKMTAERHNRAGLSNLQGPSKTYEGVFTGSFTENDSDKLPSPEFLDLKLGARVMFTKNDQAKRWVNGSLGTVSGIQDTAIQVRLDDTRDEHLVGRDTWEKIQHEWNHAKRRIEAKVVGTYTQIPLTPAWAITIHKAQGLTLSDVRVDLESGAFSEGQTYVALSRAKTLDGLSLARPINIGDVKVNPDLVRGVRRLINKR